MEAKERTVLFTGPRLLLRMAGRDDIDYILRIEFEPENKKFIVPFDRAYHENIMTSPDAMDVIAEERDTGENAGYFMVHGLQTEARELEWTHVIIEKKGKGYGHEGMKLLKAWGFDGMKYHRAWLDCKDYNARALHLYESEGMIREGLMRETLLTDGVYENLVILGILDREYRARKEKGLEL